MSATISLALRSSIQLGALWRTLCSDLYVFHLFTSNYSVDRNPLADVYFYNFPDDRRALKFLGEYAHYWFIKGFGNVEQLKDSHYAPIDIPIIDSIISLVVQEYFCYRIWTLNKRLLWPCVAIAIVRGSPLLSQAGAVVTLPGYRLP
jgi:hypothetical protein